MTPATDPNGSAARGRRSRSAPAPRRTWEVRGRSQRRLDLHETFKPFHHLDQMRFLGPPTEQPGVEVEVEDEALTAQQEASLNLYLIS